jgi:lipid-binding SYLF domain-containing protein
MSPTTPTSAVMIAWLVVGTRPAVAGEKAVPAAKALGAKAQAILVFPKVTKAGLGIGGQHGDGDFSAAAKPSRTTTRRVRRSASRQGARPTATRCSS